MRAFSFVQTACVLGVLVPAPTLRADQLPDTAAAQALRREMEELRREFESRMAALEARLAAVEAGRPPVPAGPQDRRVPAAGPESGPPTAEVPAGAAGAGGPSGVLPVYGNVSAASKIFNPDIAVIGNVLGAAGRNQVRGAPALHVPEAEATFQAIVDPYARADFFLAFGEEGVDLEEGFMTFPTLPGGLLARVGKMRASFGKVNAMHRHLVPWIDRPIVTENLLGGEEGISDAGVSVARLIPNPWVFLEATGQMFRGESAGVFRSTRRGDLAFLGHLRGYQDISESTNVDLGVSYGYGRNDTGPDAVTETRRPGTRLIGVDATVRWRPLRRSVYRSFIGRSELIWSRRDWWDGPHAASGFYVSGDYQFGRRWFTGARVDRSARADNAFLRDTGQSVTLTFWPSEFSQLRGQLRRSTYAEGTRSLEFLFQLQFSIGAHGAHPF
jgi:hypothetical protein